MSLLNLPTHDHAKLCLMWHPINRNAQSFTTSSLYYNGHCICLSYRCRFHIPGVIRLLFIRTEARFPRQHYAFRFTLAHIPTYRASLLCSQVLFCISQFCLFRRKVENGDGLFGVFRVWSLDEERQADDIVAHHVCIKIRPAGQ